MLKVRYARKFKWRAINVSIDEIKNDIFPKATHYSVVLYKNEKIVHLTIAHGEIYHKCTDEEWDDILRFVDEKIGLPEPFFDRLKKKIKKAFLEDK